ncbi:MAG: PQQ-binding-like beta-propeller repeat protein, partial [Candidatus Hydrogenedentes bacterium]|nr:PQQ-binding-like beta-propeller repeat protein [Candidatus Hydrogenedentota bacterium]
MSVNRPQGRRLSLRMAAVLTLLLSATAVAQQDRAIGDWLTFGGDAASTKYSQLDQINAENVGDLEITWRWPTPDAAITADNRNLRPGQFKATPLAVGGTLYISTPLGVVVAINGETGEPIWVFDPESWRAGRPANTGFQHRGVAYWSDGDIGRILIATHDRHLLAIDTKTGARDLSFGDNGAVDLSKGLGRPINPRLYTFNSPPVVCNDVVVIGSIIQDSPITKEEDPGHIRGYDIRTGKHLWTFNTIPQAGEFGVDTWENDSWKYTGACNVWSIGSADEELDHVYMPTTTPTDDWYGGHRLGNNLFAESILCLNAKTGERVWHYQTVHHGLWDYDNASTPVLADITVDGREIKAVAMVTKQAFTFVFDRVTGEPVWPIEERPVPSSNVPGEVTAATQPFPTKPPAFDRQGISKDDLIDFTPELRAEAMEMTERWTFGPLFEPPTAIEKGPDGNLGTIQIPGAFGGANWPGASFDPETDTLFVPSKTTVTRASLSKGNPQRSNLNYYRGGAFDLIGPRGLPLVKPPYARITAIDLNAGKHLWQVPHGDGP